MKNKIEKAFSPIGCAMNEKSYKMTRHSLNFHSSPGKDDRTPFMNLMSCHNEFTATRQQKNYEFVRLPAGACCLKIF